MSATEEQGLSMVLHDDGSARVLQLVGELDISSAPALREQLRDLLAADADVVVDLSTLSFMDSSGISVLIVAHKRSLEQGRRLTLRRPGGPVAKVLEVSGTDQVFSIEL
jgi:anti-sigma B factor antagonist